MKTSLGFNKTAKLIKKIQKSIYLYIIAIFICIWKDIYLRTNESVDYELNGSK